MKHAHALRMLRTLFREKGPGEALRKIRSAWRSGGLEELRLRYHRFRARRQPASCPEEELPATLPPSPPHSSVEDGNGMALAADYSMTEAEFEALVADRAGILLRTEPPGDPGTLFVYFRQGAGPDALSVSLTRLFRARRPARLTLRVLVSSHEAEGLPESLKKSGIELLEDDRALARLLSGAEADDALLLLRGGDEVHETLLEVVAASRPGRKRICLVDLALREGDRIFPCFLPGVNPAHAMNCDYFRSRFFAKARAVADWLQEGRGMRPRDLALWLLDQEGPGRWRQRTRHLALPLVLIQETRAEFREERALICKDTSEARYSLKTLERMARRVSVVICTHDKGFLVEQLVESLLRQFPDPIAEIVIVSNQSENPHALRVFERLSRHPALRILDYDRPFNFSEQCNLAAWDCRGDILLFLNNDVVPVNGDWLRELLQPFDCPEIGATGPLLLYPDERVQHAGMYMGLHSLAGHTMRFARLPEEEYMFLATAPRDVVALTGAALAVRTDLFRNLKGFDRQFSTYIQDVDLCLRIFDSGYRVLFNPRSILLHMESVSVKSILENPGLMESRGLQHEFFTRRWKERVFDDPFHNPNYHRQDESLRCLYRKLPR